MDKYKDLANKAFNKKDGGKSYKELASEAFGNNPKWDESKHPRDGDGKFTDKETSAKNENIDKSINYNKEKGFINDGKDKQLKFEEVYDKAVKNEPAITNDLEGITGKVGAELTGLEQRLKSQSRAREKIVRDRKNPDDIYDFVRHTQQSPPESLTNNANQTIDNLLKKKYNIIEIKNTWNDDNSPYKGVNVKMIDPRGQRFELQFHTAESFATKQSMHDLYERQQKHQKGSPEWVKYETQMLEMSKTLLKPNNIENLGR